MEGGRNYRTPPATIFFSSQGGVEGSVRLLLLTLSSSSWSNPLPETQYLIWAVSRPATILKYYFRLVHIHQSGDARTWSIKNTTFLGRFLITRILEYTSKYIIFYVYLPFTELQVNKKQLKHV